MSSELQKWTITTHLYWAQAPARGHLGRAEQGRGQSVRSLAILQLPRRRCRLPADVPKRSVSVSGSSLQPRLRLACPAAHSAEEKYMSLTKEHFPFLSFSWRKGKWLLWKLFLILKGTCWRGSAGPKKKTAGGVVLTCGGERPWKISNRTCLPCCLQHTSFSGAPLLSRSNLLQETLKEHCRWTFPFRYKLSFQEPVVLPLCGKHSLHLPDH